MTVGINGMPILPAKPKTTMPKQFRSVAKKMNKSKATKGKNMKAYKQGYRAV